MEQHPVHLRCIQKNPMILYIIVYSTVDWWLIGLVQTKIIKMMLQCHTLHIHPFMLSLFLWVIYVIQATHYCQGFTSVIETMILKRSDPLLDYYTPGNQAQLCPTECWIGSCNYLCIQLLFQHVPLHLFHNNNKCRLVYWVIVPSSQLRLYLVIALLYRLYLYV